jgi:hypothetical protein
MDETLLMNAGLTTSGVALVLIAYRIFKTIQGKKLVSSCCGRRMEMGVDVVPMTPPEVTSVNLRVNNPLRLKRMETLGLPDGPKAGASHEANSSI